MKLKWTLLFLILFGAIPVSVCSTGTVYLVFGSDTAIWDGMSVNRYQSTYNLDLYTNPLLNAYEVMDPAFRAQFTDSYGQAMKMTWWMMAGNIFRHATNTNVPVPNIMTLYLMQQYHGENVLINGDELSLHYHTFFWSDYDQDGVYFWNQAQTFGESRADFDVTLAQFLLEEDVFPVSFRSGWHFMDNEWQHVLNDILPYSMHNDWPAHRIDNEEPTDNNFDWSEAPQSFVPFRPSLDNYQLPGDGPGWNVRSASFQKVASQGLMDTVFAHASEGIDQVACFWAHLPETDFPDNMALMDQLAHEAADLYPDVDFRYCTAIEAMQRWRGTLDETQPELSIMVQGSGDNLRYSIASNEVLFQPQPFVAAKFKDESFRVIHCTQTGDNTWLTDIIPFSSELAKIGFAATDTSGNHTTVIFPFIPDDIYVDNTDPEYHELAGNWSSNPATAWGVDSRIAQVDADNPIHVAWSPNILEPGYYHVSMQVPEVSATPSPIDIVIHSGTNTDTLSFTSPLPANEWIYLATPELQPGQSQIIELFSRLPESISSAELAVDVIKFSAMVRDRDLRLSSQVIDFAEVSLGQPVTRNIQINNRGLEALTIQGIQSVSGHVNASTQVPFTIPGRDKFDLALNLQPDQMGLLNDTLVIQSNDSMHPELQIVVTAIVQYPFYVVDNEDVAGYSESGSWFTSVAQAFGASSRYAWLNAGAWATFTLNPEVSAIYDIFEMVPTTVNATNDALYILKIAGIAVDSVFQDQNNGSGDWVNLGRHYLPSETSVVVEVHDTGSSTAGVVLRTDALKFQLIQPVSLDEEFGKQTAHIFTLFQNYPNPFNPATTLRFQIPVQSSVNVTVFDVQGHEVIMLRNAMESAGSHELIWNGMDKTGHPVSTGVYFCRLRTDQHSQTIKMLLIR
ncbi:MAG: T9SS type A sorting domain-containing protein [Candidatus Marinimicrobia bacterium]|nr:T9SS type A sorting domain-containing protein [Candidatus Neomarinimicrobiota bacterium]